MATDLAAAIKAESWWSNAFKIPTGNYFQHGTQSGQWLLACFHLSPSFSASLQGRKTGSGQCTVSQIDVSLLLQIFKCQPVTCQLSLHVLWKPGSTGWQEGGSEGKSRLEPKEDTRASSGSQQTWQQEIKLYLRTEISEFLCHCSITYPMLIKQ